MLRLVIFLLGVAAAATGLAWLADRPGNLLISWQGYEIETSVFRGIVMLTLLIGVAILLWSIIRQIWDAPASVGLFFNRRRQKKGLEALSTGMIAIGAGDRALATRAAVQARRALPNEPLTHLLRAQAAQLSGDRITSRRIFEAMLGSPETEQLGLRGLFLEAERERETEAARQFAERAIKLNPKLGWSADALFDLQCRSGDWVGALDTISVAKKHGLLDKTVANRRRAVLLTARAQAAEDSNPNVALGLAMEATHLAADLVPAAAIAGRILAARGNTPKAARVIQRTWKLAQHPDLAVAYAYARLGDSPLDRLNRVKQLAALVPNSTEGGIALATAAIEAKDFATARNALAYLQEGRMTQRVATLMARIEGEEHGDKGRVREWLARAVNAPRDPVWTADGFVSDRWAPISPVTGALDAFQWRLPVEATEPRDADVLAAKLEELVALGARREAAIEAPDPLDVPAVPAKGQIPIARDVEDAIVADTELRPEAATPQTPASAAPSSQPAKSSASPRPASAGPTAMAAAAASASQEAVVAAMAERTATAAAASKPSLRPVENSTGGTGPATTNGTKKGFAKAPEAAVFVAPRAPDDPGPEQVDEAPAPIRNVASAR